MDKTILKALSNSKGAVDMAGVELGGVRLGIGTRHEILGPDRRFYLSVGGEKIDLIPQSGNGIYRAKVDGRTFEITFRSDEGPITVTAFEIT